MRPIKEVLANPRLTKYYKLPEGTEAVLTIVATPQDRTPATPRDRTPATPRGKGATPQDRGVKKGSKPAGGKPGKRRFRPGTRALQEIRNYQKSTNLMRQVLVQSSLTVQRIYKILVLQ